MFNRGAAAAFVVLIWVTLFTLLAYDSYQKCMKQLETSRIQINYLEESLNGNP